MLKPFKKLTNYKESPPTKVSDGTVWELKKEDRKPPPPPKPEPVIPKDGTPLEIYLSLFKRPFVYHKGGQMVFDAEDSMVGQMENGAFKVRGWGRISSRLLAVGLDEKLAARVQDAAGEEFARLFNEAHP